ncbi:glycosyl hydrolase family 18 protein [Anoxybacillus sp. FSL W8-1294]|uniref:glycosyl hydrolase family 18 protein n=1 Tax=Anoxybacillus sp. FSL W8-1294 TaxID=2954655 RepID=UPI0030CC6D61
MSIKFLSWSLNEPSNVQFEQYAREIALGQWQIIDPDAWKNWGGDQRNFWYAFLAHHQKFYAFGLHDFGVLADGSIYHYKAGESYPVLTSDESAIRYWMRDSLRYLVDHYPNIKWSLQMVCFGESRVEPMLDNVNNCQDTFIRQLKKIAQLYMDRFPGRIKGIEMDFEKSSSRSRSYQEAEKYRDLLVRVKNEVCIPLGLELRVNLHAMTGDFEPHWYQWTDYRTVASGIDANGNQAIDEFQIMSYDFSHNNSAPGPSTPIWWLIQVLEHVKNVLPPEKVFIGNAAYGRRWPLNEKRSGNAVRYWQLLMWQNGLFRHNAGQTNENGEFVWYDQSFIPYVGFHDEESGYEKTFLHVYDRFAVQFAKLIESFNGTDVIFRSTYNGQDYITSYSKHQRAEFTGIQKIITDVSSRSGNTRQGTTWTPSDTLPGYTFIGYSAHSAVYNYNEDLNTCEPAEDETGQDGKLIYSFTLPSAGNYRLIAAVYFPYLNPRIPILVNGQSFTIGEIGNQPEWYPFYVNPSKHFYDCGVFSFGTSNTIEVGVCSDDAQILGFIVCQNFEHGMSGGEVEYTVNLHPAMKRGTVQDGIVSKVEADFPDQMTITGELLRRPPRPAIIWEDMFGPHVNSGITDLAQTRYYLHVDPDYVPPGSNPDPNLKRCVGPAVARGYSNGVWKPIAATETEEAHVYADTRSQSMQLILNRQYQMNAHIEADLRADSNDRSAVYGIRFYADTPGEIGKGYVFVADHSAGQFYLKYESGGSSQVLASAPLNITLGNRYTFKVRVVGNHIKCLIGNDTVVIDYPSNKSFPGQLTKGAHGIYARNCRVKCYRLQIATNDRYEPMEKVSAIVDGVEHIALKESRPYSYDELGYMVYSGFDPDEGLGIKISNDYENLPIATVPSWRGNKTIRIRMVDAGVWLRNFYIGDSSGFSIAWNSDLEGFIRTLRYISEYGCKGVAMWTVGQEDPRVFAYLPTPE